MSTKAHHMCFSYPRCRVDAAADISVLLQVSITRYSTILAYRGLALYRQSLRYQTQLV